MLPDILLIADEPELCQQVTDILDEYDVDWCFEYEALNICIHQPVRVVLVVQDLPGASGIELFQLRKNKQDRLSYGSVSTISFNPLKNCTKSIYNAAGYPVDCGRARIVSTGD
jgi:DNA-binding NtrC family response regulator